MTVSTFNKFQNTVYLLLLFLAVNKHVWAQTLQDPIYLNYTHFAKSGNNDTAGKLVSNFFEFNFTGPTIKIGKKITCNPAVYYRNTALQYEPQTSSFPTILHDARLSAIFRANINKYFEVVFLPRVLLRSDLGQSVSGNDFFPYLVLLGNYAVKGNPNFKIGVGLALNNDFSHNAIIPTGTLMYNNSKCRIEISYPNANILYKHKNNIEVGLFANIDGSISKIQPVQLSSTQASYARSFQLLMAPAFSFRIHQNFFANLKAGYVMLRRIDVMDEKFTVLRDQTLHLSSTYFFRVGISYRLANK